MVVFVKVVYDMRVLILFRFQLAEFDLADYTVRV